VLIVQYFPHAQPLKDPARTLVERGAFLLGVLGIAERHEAPALPVIGLSDETVGESPVLFPLRGAPL